MPDCLPKTESLKFLANVNVLSRVDIRDRETRIESLEQIFTFLNHKSSDKHRRRKNETGQKKIKNCRLRSEESEHKIDSDVVGVTSNVRAPP